MFWRSFSRLGMVTEAGVGGEVGTHLSSACGKVNKEALGTALKQMERLGVFLSDAQKLQNSIGGAGDQLLKDTINEQEVQARVNPHKESDGGMAAGVLNASNPLQGGARDYPRARLSKDPSQLSLTQLSVEFLANYQKFSCLPFTTLDGSRKVSSSVTVNYDNNTISVQSDMTRAALRNPKLVDLKETTGVIIFCHGIGDSGRNWAKIFRPLSKLLPHIKFVLPTAMDRGVTMNGGARMPAWYDIKDLGTKLHADAEGLDLSCALVKSIIHLEAQRLAPYGGAERIMVGGFSQGGAVAHAVAHTYPEKLGGVISLSGYLTGKSYLHENFTDVNNDTPLYASHGADDPMISLSTAKDSFKEVMTLRKKAGGFVDEETEEKNVKIRNATTASNVQVEKEVLTIFRNMQHEVTPLVMHEVTRFVREFLPPARLRVDGASVISGREKE